jgi:hypothetical protein
MKLIQNKKKKNRYNENKKFSLLGKSSGLIPLVSNLAIGAWSSGLCGEGCCPFCQTAWGRDNWRFFFFISFFFLLSFVLWAIHCK